MLRAKLALSCCKGRRLEPAQVSHLPAASWGPVQGQLLLWTLEGHASGSPDPGLACLREAQGPVPSRQSEHRDRAINSTCVCSSPPHTPVAVGIRRAEEQCLDTV